MGFVTREAIGSESYCYPTNAARDQMPHEFQEMSTLTTKDQAEDYLLEQSLVQRMKNREKKHRSKVKY
jgi:N-acetylmuramoyl-L-alanine amidase